MDRNADLPWTKAHSELLNHLKCRAHGRDQWCWKPNEAPFNGKTCLVVPANDLFDWAKAISSGVATIHVPPDTEAFHKLKQSHHKYPSQKGRQNNPDNSPVNFQVFLDQNSIAQRTSRAPQTPQHTRSRSLDLAPSPIRQFSPREYNKEGLRAYLEWLSEESGDDDYKDLYLLLSEQKIGIDIIQQAAAKSNERERLLKELKSDFLIVAGVANRLVMNFNKWHTTLASID